MEHTIEVRDLTKRYGTTLAVAGLSFRVRPGRVTGFLGPNGSGKSTTMRAILGLDRPTSGQALVNGRPYRALRRPLYEVGALLDAAAVAGGRSAYHHLLAVARSNGIAAARVREVLDRVGLTGVANQPVRGFSLGMKQRLGIATALLGDPYVLIFDEPVNGLDPEGIRWIRELLRGLAGQGRAVLVSSHLMSEMAQTADHLVVIGRGRLIADCSVDEFIAGGTGGYVRARSPRAADLAALLSGHGATVTVRDDGALAVTGLDAAAVGELALAAGLPVHELGTEYGSLEDAYLRQTDDAVEYRVGDHA